MANEPELRRPTDLGVLVGIKSGGGPFKTQSPETSPTVTNTSFDVNLLSPVQAEFFADIADATQEILRGFGVREKLAWIKENIWNGRAAAEMNRLKQDDKIESLPFLFWSQDKADNIGVIKDDAHYVLERIKYSHRTITKWTNGHRLEAPYKNIWTQTTHYPSSPGEWMNDGVHWSSYYSPGSTVSVSTETTVNFVWDAVVMDVLFEPNIQSNLEYGLVLALGIYSGYPGETHPRTNPSFYTFSPRTTSPEGQIYGALYNSFEQEPELARVLADYCTRLGRDIQHPADRLKHFYTPYDRRPKWIYTKRRNGL